MTDATDQPLLRTLAPLLRALEKQLRAWLVSQKKVTQLVSPFRLGPPTGHDRIDRTTYRQINLQQVIAEFIF